MNGNLRTRGVITLKISSKAPELSKINPHSSNFDILWRISELMLFVETGDTTYAVFFWAKNSSDYALSSS